ncbi:MAPEG family protein [Kordiimonas sp. SCSIO 12610]|uniref:MAPEG family protein n=1 Tax=Kordiimonas sp. SCSIO 12610 TaxID=2829597 RepID=UPI00210D2BE5|nr:MAPEG family protein [Kordiimonas sp. SCSIO 12610]UTW56382.1 MAPEG family protein [Kordiimonas sp. SCSIO 12610]
MNLGSLIGSMTTELNILLYSVILTFVLVLIPAARGIRENGAEAQAGPRDDLPEPSVFRKRATRLKDNMLENMMFFAPTILVANAAGVSNDYTVMGAWIFFIARVVHAILYLTAVPKIRPLAWFASLIGIGMIMAQVL